MNQYRVKGTAAWLMHDLTAATIRKIRNGAGAQPGPSYGSRALRQV
jgi:hypothetical protein